MTNWYAVYTRPRCEKKVAESFTKKKIESYYPINRIARQKGSKKVAQLPLFASYVFARLNEVQLQDVRKIDGVINLVYWLGAPIVVRDIEVEMMRRFLHEHTDVRFETIPIDPKAIVKISQEPFDDEELSENLKTVKLLLPSLGYSLVASERRESVIVLTNYQHDRPYKVSL